MSLFQSGRPKGRFFSSPGSLSLLPDFPVRGARDQSARQGTKVVSPQSKRGEKPLRREPADTQSPAGPGLGKRKKWPVSRRREGNRCRDSCRAGFLFSPRCPAEPAFHTPQPPVFPSPRSGLAAQAPIQPSAGNGWRTEEAQAGQILPDRMVLWGMAG